MTLRLSQPIDEPRLCGMAERSPKRRINRNNIMPLSASSVATGSSSTIDTCYSSTFIARPGVVYVVSVTTNSTVFSVLSITTNNNVALTLRNTTTGTVSKTFVYTGICSSAQSGLVTVLFDGDCSACVAVDELSGANAAAPAVQSNGTAGSATTLSAATAPINGTIVAVYNITTQPTFDPLFTPLSSTVNGSQYLSTAYRQNVDTAPAFTGWFNGTITAVEVKVDDHAFGTGSRRSLMGMGV